MQVNIDTNRGEEAVRKQDEPNIERMKMLVIMIREIDNMGKRSKTNLLGMRGLLSKISRTSASETTGFLDG